MNDRATFGVLTLAAALVLCGTASADLVNVSMTDVSDQINPPPGVTTWRVIAHFDDPTDSALAVFSAPGIPLEFETNDEQGLINAGGPFAGRKDEDFPTSPISFNYDSWVTIGGTDINSSEADYTPSFLDNNGVDAVILGSVWSEAGDYEGWFDANPGTPEDGGDVVLAQFSIRSGFSIRLSGVLVWRRASQPGFLTSEFSAAHMVPPDFGACCLGPTECVVTTAENCAGIGGLFVGVGVPCSTQVTMAPCHPGDVAQHCVLPVIDCPEGEAPGPGGCTPGPLLDPWISSNDDKGGDTTFHDFGGPGQAIPAGFFDSGSDPYNQPVGLVGVPLGPVDLGEFGIVEFGEADTLIQRSQDPFDRCELPSDTDERIVEIEIVALNLRSVDPIIVTFNGGMNPEAWDIDVQLSDFPPPPGTMTVIKDHCNGGTYTIDSLLVQPKFIFTKVSDPSEVRELDTGMVMLNPVDLSLPETPWVHDIDEALAVASPFCTQFHPGIEDRVQTVDCDCNTNNVRDKCDLESGESSDCNENEIPDECEEPCAADLDADLCVTFQDLLILLSQWSADPDSCPGCPADLDQDDDVDFQDLLILLASWGPCV